MKIIRISKSQIEQGVEVEKEHSAIYDELCAILGDKMPWTLEEFVKKIAEDHLEEFSDYYTRLKEMEKEAEPEHK